ncbi:hypothetical protein AOLI_G00004650 [Acnodon oligacanthus]
MTTPTNLDAVSLLKEQVTKDKKLGLDFEFLQHFQSLQQEALVSASGPAPVLNQVPVHASAAGPGLAPGPVLLLDPVPDPALAAALSSERLIEQSVCETLTEERDGQKNGGRKRRAEEEQIHRSLLSLRGGKFKAVQQA